MFNEKISRRSFLTGGTKVAAALFVAPAIIKIDHLMKLYVPPEKAIILDPYSYNFTLQGMEPGSRVLVTDEVTGKIYIDEMVNVSRRSWDLPEGEGRTVIVGAQKPGYASLVIRMGLPYPDAKNKLVIQMPRDRIIT